jgi:hypothetical protein
VNAVTTPARRWTSPTTEPFCEPGDRVVACGPAHRVHVALRADRRGRAGVQFILLRHDEGFGWRDRARLWFPLDHAGAVADAIDEIAGATDDDGDKGE